MILDILTVLFFVLGFALLMWMIGERRRDVLHGPYVTKWRARSGARDDRRHRMAAREPPNEMSNVADELSRVVRDIERDRSRVRSRRRRGNEARPAPNRTTLDARRGRTTFGVARFENGQGSDRS